MVKPPLLAYIAAALVRPVWRLMYDLH